MELKKRFGRSTAWMSIAASGTSIVSFIIFVVLSRLLSAEEIGLVAFAILLVETGAVVVGTVFSKAIVQYPVWDERFSSTCFYLNLVFSVALALVFLLAGAPLVSAYYDPAAGPVLQALSAIFFLEGIRAVHEGKLNREFAFRVIAIRTMLSSAISGIVGITLALQGYGIWALVWQQLVNHIMITLITLGYGRWTPKRQFSVVDLRKLLGFSSPLMGAQFMGAVSARTFELLVGVIIGPAALGFFKVGGRALYILQDIVLKPFERTILAALARLPEKDQAGATLRVIRMSAFVTFPVFFGTASVAPEFIVFAFGDKWALSGKIMAIMAMGIAPMVVCTQIKGALTASGRSQLILALAAVMLVVSLIMAGVSVSLGLYIAACGFAARNYVAMFCYLHLFRKVYAVPMGRALMTVAPAFFSSLLMACAVVVLRVFLPDDMHPGLALVILCGSGFTVHTLLMTTLFRRETAKFLEEGTDILPKVLQPLAIRLRRLVSH